MQKHAKDLDIRKQRRAPYASVSEISQTRNVDSVVSWMHDDNDVVPGLDAFYHGCVAVLRNNTSINIRLVILGAYSSGQARYIKELLEEVYRFLAHLKIEFVIQVSSALAWRSCLRRMAELQGVEWSIKTTKETPVPGVD